MHLKPVLAKWTSRNSGNKRERERGRKRRDKREEGREEGG